MVKKTVYNNSLFFTALITNT